ncbi:MAG TPA: DNA mismatch repair protein [Chitinophaga sp.]
MGTFATDKQTLEDLQIFGRKGGQAIYSLFNRCMTKKGMLLLEEMFEYPLSDAAAINRRSGIISCFAGEEQVFPFDATAFDTIEAYLANRDERSRLSGQSVSLAQKLGYLLAPDADTALIHNGIAAMVALLKQVRQFIDTATAVASADYQEDRAQLAALLAAAPFSNVLAQQDKLTPEIMAQYDTLFRFRDTDQVRRLLDKLYLLDVYIAVAGVARANGFAFPRALPPDRHVLHLEGVYHPRLEKPVANDIRITPADNVIFLTGANMAGKSTFMKALSIAVFLAHMGFPVPAARMEFSVLDGMYTTINLSDNLHAGASHFYAEVLRVKKVAHQLSQSKNLFIVFDELFRGTNVKDAYEATIAVTAAFASRRNSLFVISSHIIEAGEALGRCDNIRFLYLPTRMQGQQPLYTYRLEEGITDDRHGMVIIRHEQILDMLHAGIRESSQTTVA